MDESSLISSLALYNSQIQQLEMGIAAASDDNTRQELMQLLKEMQQLVTLTEDSLLSLKKGNLLISLNVNETNEPLQTGPESSMKDEEYDAFMKSIYGESSVDDSDTDTSEENFQSIDCNDFNYNKTEDLSNENLDIDKMVGTKCRVPYRENWGPTSLNNCMVCGLEPIEADQDPKIRVLFCNPTSLSMQPCPYYLDGSCKFDEENCRFSHGYIVAISDLQEFLEPDFSKLSIGSYCLAKFSGDNLWYKAAVVEIEENYNFRVMFDNYGDVEVKSLEEIVPHCDDNTTLDIDETEYNSDTNVSNPDDEDPEDYPRLSTMPALASLDALGEWEKHTKGIGSKIMKQMGYIFGQGLGKDNSGKVDLVPISVLPPGKSLDKIMEMKEKAQNENLFDIFEKKKRFSKKEEHTIKSGYDKVGKPDVFEFLNTKLTKSNLENSKKSTFIQTPATVVEKKDMKSYSDKKLNIQIFQTHEEVRNVDKELRKLNGSLKRNSTCGLTAQKLKKKISEMEAYKKQLVFSSKSIENIKNTRKDNSKLSIF